jgi:hypothetical protein
LVAVFQQHLQKLDMPMRDALTRLFADSRDLLMEQCIDSELIQTDRLIQSDCDEYIAKDCVAQRDLRDTELNALVNHCSGPSAADHLDDDDLINAPLVVAFLEPHFDALYQQWLSLIKQHRGCDSSTRAVSECEGLAHAVVFDFLRRVQYQLTNDESPVPLWSVGSMQLMTDEQQQDIIDCIRDNELTWNNETVLKQVEQADRVRSVCTQLCPLRCQGVLFYSHTWTRERVWTWPLCCST